MRRDGHRPFILSCSIRPGSGSNTAPSSARGRAEDLPFSDNEFDIVTLITSLEFTDDPGPAVAEAIRVCRGRVFIGVMNRYSLIGAQGRLTSLFDSIDPAANVRYFHLARLTAMIRSQLQGVRIQWGSVIFLPWGWYRLRRRSGRADPRDEQPLRRLLRPLLLRHLLLPDDPADHPGARRTECGRQAADARGRKWVEKWFMKRFSTKRKRTAG